MANEQQPKRAEIDYSNPPADLAYIALSDIRAAYAQGRADARAEQDALPRTQDTADAASEIVNGHAHNGNVSDGISFEGSVIINERTGRRIIPTGVNVLSGLVRTSFEPVEAKEVIVPYDQ